jgi:hypothetical protein
MARSSQMTFRKTLLVIMACPTLSTGASARTWTTVTGQHFEAEFVRVEGANGIFSVKGKDYPYPLNQLSVADRLLVGRAVNQRARAGSSLPATEPSPTATDTASSATATPASVDKTAETLQFAGQPLESRRKRAS